MYSGSKNYIIHSLIYWWYTTKYLKKVAFILEKYGLNTAIKQNIEYILCVEISVYGSLLIAVMLCVFKPED